MITQQIIVQVVAATAIYFAIGYAVFVLILRPMARQRFIWSITTVVADLEWDALEGRVPRSEALQVLNREAMATTAMISHLSFSMIYFWSRHHLHEEEIKRKKMLFKTAPEQLRRAQNRIARVSLGAALLNSPAWWVPFGVLVLCSHLIESCGKLYGRWKTASAYIPECLAEKRGLRLA